MDELKTRLTNLSTTFHHGTIASNWRKALLIIIITKLIMSATNKQLNCQGTIEVKVSQGQQSIPKHTQAISWFILSILVLIN